ncbi:hypothetical protein GOP47_0028394 [Adiantum capillus-veneris]|nr:hypothetical protein GOP47_0028394 [Adiantum capillus-veneris]
MVVCQLTGVLRAARDGAVGGHADGARFCLGSSSPPFYLFQKMEVKAVFFDMDDTLVPSHAADTCAFLAVARLLASRAPHVDHQAVIDKFLLLFFAQPWDPHHQIDVTEWRSQLWNRALLCQNVEDMDLARDMQTCFDAERLRVFRWGEGVEALVRRLQAQGYKTGIITNGHSKIQRAKLKACRAEELFGVILVGGEQPDEKPHKDIFLKACKMVGCEPDKAIFVGDTLKTDIQGGFNAGFLATVWIDIHGSGRPKGKALP